MAAYPWIRDGAGFLQSGKLVVTSTSGLGFTTTNNNNITGFTNTTLSITSPGTGTVAINTNVNVSEPGILSVGTTTNNSYILFNGKKLYVTVTDPATVLGNTVAAGDIWISTS
jgi:hypothetical protein